MKDWTEASAQAKVYAVVHVISMLTEFVGEVSLFDMIPQGNKTIRTRFWAQYLIGAAYAVLVGIVGFRSVDCLAKSGWKKLSWAAVAISPVLLASGGFLLHGVDSILGSSSGTGAVALVGSAYAAKKKKSKSK